MKNVSLAAGIAIVLIANTFALIHAARNRMGNADAVVTLTNRELSFNRAAASEDSGVTLILQKTTLGDSFSLYGNTSPKWFHQQKLQELGFDCSVDPTISAATRFYQRQRPRQAFVALEYEGEAWHAWLDSYRAAQLRPEMGSAERDSLGDESRLFPIDADLNPAALRTRYPDRSRVLIVPAVLSLALVPYVYTEGKPLTQTPRRLEGRIDKLTSSVHVPRPFSDEFQRPKADRTYSVTLRYGTLFEPWVTGVKFAKP